MLYFVSIHVNVEREMSHIACSCLDEESKSSYAAYGFRTFKRSQLSQPTNCTGEVIRQSCKGESSDVSQTAYSLMITLILLIFFNNILISANFQQQICTLVPKQRASVVIVSEMQRVRYLCYLGITHINSSPVFRIPQK